MCLDRIDEKTKRGGGCGYKAFNRSGNTLVPLCGRTLPFPEEEWFTDPNTTPILGKYPAGFHINRFKKHARSWDGHTTRKVFYADVVASGTWEGTTDEPVYIARKIWITKEEI